MMIGDYSVYRAKALTSNKIKNFLRKMIFEALNLPVKLPDLNSV